jgi:uncharacterized protein YecT (DUF1311 family)
MAGTEGGDTTLGMVACTAAETAAWDTLLNEVYAALMIEARRRAGAAADEGREAPDHEALLREAQRAWLVFRDADCAQEVAVWEEGSTGRIAGAYCMLDRTATRVLELTDKRRSMEPR